MSATFDSKLIDLKSCLGSKILRLTLPILKRSGLAPEAIKNAHKRLSVKYCGRR